MKLTTKGRYAVMAMADLALNSKKGPTSLNEISLRQNISLAYLEQIFIKLKSKNLSKAQEELQGVIYLISLQQKLSFQTSFMQLTKK